MKIIHQIFIVIFIATSLILVKGDVINIYHHSVDYLSQKVLIVLNKDKKQLLVSEDNKEVIKLPKIIETPGALEVSNNFLIYNIINTKLSLENVINITNKYRTENGNLKALTENQKLDFSAEKKLQDMFKEQYFEHKSPEGIGVSDLVDQISYEYITVGENLALGNFDSDQALVDAWMASIGHRENILNSHYTEIGVAVGEGLFDGKKTWMAVQHFGLPRNICPEIDEVLHGIILLNEKQTNKIETNLILRKTMIDNKVVYEDLTTDEQIDKYNSLIVTYNQLISGLKSKIKKYNKQVRIFNSCITDNTTVSPE